MENAVDKKLAADLSRCVLCGGCKASCPTYGEEPSEALAARGRVRLLRELAEGGLKPSAELCERIYNCILCGACEGSCPLGVDIPGAIYRGRRRLTDFDRRLRYWRPIIRMSMRWPGHAFRAARIGRGVLPLLARRGLIPFVPDLPEAPFAKEDQVIRVNKRRGRVAVFSGCSINYLFPQLGESLVNVLHHLGFEVILPKSETCCGAPLRALGLEEEAAEHAKRNHRVFSRLKVDAVVSLCPTCTHNLGVEYPKMTGRGLEKVMDLSVFLADVLGRASLIEKSAVFHDPCHLRYGLGVTEEPREIIRRAGLELRAAEETGCCGFGGTFSLLNREMSSSLRRRQAERLIRSNADVVVTSCPGCILQLSREISDRPVLHLIEVIEEAFCLRTEQPSLLVV